MYIGFKTSFYVVRHLDSTASCLPTDLHLGFFRSWPSLYLPSSFSSVFLVLSFVSASTSMLFWVMFLLPFFEHSSPPYTYKIMFGEQYTSLTKLLTVKFPLALHYLSLLTPNIFLSTPLSNNHSLCLSPFYTHTKQETQLEFCISILVFLDNHDEKMFWTEWWQVLCQFNPLLISSQSNPIQFYLS